MKKIIIRWANIYTKDKSKVYKNLLLTLYTANILTPKSTSITCVPVSTVLSISFWLPTNGSYKPLYFDYRPNVNSNNESFLVIDFENFYHDLRIANPKGEYFYHVTPQANLPFETKAVSVASVLT